MTDSCYCPWLFLQMTVQSFASSVFQVLGLPGCRLCESIPEVVSGLQGCPGKWTMHRTYGDAQVVYPLCGGTAWAVFAIMVGSSRHKCTSWLMVGVRCYIFSLAMIGMH